MKKFVRMRNYLMKLRKIGSLWNVPIVPKRTGLTYIIQSIFAFTFQLTMQTLKQFSPFLFIIRIFIIRMIGSCDVDSPTTKE